MKCANCNKQIPEGADFCPFCLTMVGANSESNKEGRVCPSCKTPAKDNDKFCKICGTPIEVVSVQQTDVNKKEKGTSQNTNKMLVLIITVMAVIILVLVSGLIRNSTKKEASFENETFFDSESFSGDNNISDDTADEFLFESDRYEIDESVLYGKTQHEVALIRNEIYARHGYIFSNPVYIEYFSQKSWYNPNPDFNENHLSELEKRNKDFIVEYETARGWRK